MQRREFITLLGGAAAAWPLAARAQQPAHAGGRVSRTAFAARPRAGTGARLPRRPGEAGHGSMAAMCGSNTDGRGTTIGCRRWQPIWCEAPAVIFVEQLRYRCAQRRQPRPFLSCSRIGADPGQHGLVASLNRPGGNLTGDHQYRTSSWRESGSRLLHEIAPAAARIAALVQPEQSGRRDCQANDSQRRRAASAEGSSSLGQHRTRDRRRHLQALSRSATRRSRVVPRTFIQQPANPDRHAGGAYAIPAIYASASSPRPAA